MGGFTALSSKALASRKCCRGYHVQLKPVGPDQLRGRCPLPTHGSERSRESFSVHTAKNVWACHSARMVKKSIALKTQGDSLCPSRASRDVKRRFPGGVTFCYARLWTSPSST
jgi:hypothetical protein